MDGTKGIPRMRTAAKIVAEIKALDPDTEVTEFHIRKLAKDGTVPVVWAGRKALINLDDVLELMRLGTARPWEVYGALIQNVKEVPMKKKLTFEDYREALIGVGDTTKERILAEADKHLDAWQLERLVRIAYPEPA